MALRPRSPIEVFGPGSAPMRRSQIWTMVCDRMQRAIPASYIDIQPANGIHLRWSCIDLSEHSTRALLMLLQNWGSQHSGRVLGTFGYAVFARMARGPTFCAGRWPMVAGERPPTANSPGRLPGGASGPVSIVFGFLPKKADSRRTVILQDFGI